MLYDDTFLTRRPSGCATSLQPLGIQPIFQDPGKNLSAFGTTHNNRRRVLKQRAMILPGTGSFLKPDIEMGTMTGVTENLLSPLKQRKEGSLSVRGLQEGKRDTQADNTQPSQALISSEDIKKPQRKRPLTSRPSKQEIQGQEAAGDLSESRMKVFNKTQQSLKVLASPRRSHFQPASTSVSNLLSNYQEAEHLLKTLTHPSEDYQTLITAQRAQREQRRLRRKQILSIDTATSRAPPIETSLKKPSRVLEGLERFLSSPHHAKQHLSHQQAGDVPFQPSLAASYHSKRLLNLYENRRQEAGGQAKDSNNVENRTKLAALNEYKVAVPNQGTMEGPELLNLIDQVGRREREIEQVVKRLK